MLQRVLAGFVRLEGVEQAMLIDDTGQLLASVGEEGILPPFQEAIEMIHAARETGHALGLGQVYDCLLYTSPSPRDVEESRMPSSA